MSYTIKRDSVIVAVRHTGQVEMKTVTKEHAYPVAQKNGDYFIFQVAPGSAWKEFRALRKDVEVQLDVLNVPDGTYTVVQADDTSYVTIKLETSRQEKKDDGRRNFFLGKQVISYLSGPDNENNFTGFAHLDENGGIHVWKRYRQDGAVKKYVDALVLLQQQGVGYQEEAGMTYALRSGRCRKCNRVLTVPASLHRGMGPVCSKGGTDEIPNS